MSSRTVSTFSHPISETVTAPGSKSYTNRALLMAAMTPNPVYITGALSSDDTEAMINCLRTLGISITINDDTITVHNDISSLSDATCTLDVNLSGITMRFLLALACVLPGTQILTGKDSLNKRPIEELVNGLRQLGADIQYLDKEGFPPVRINSSKLNSGTVSMDGGVSSQYFSALLMVAPLIPGELTIQVNGEQISKPYIDMTIDTMSYFGVTVKNNAYATYQIAADQAYRTEHYDVEGDVSSASYFFAIAALTGSTVTVRNLNPKSKQADMRFLDILKEMGNEVTADINSITLHGKGVHAAELDMQDCPDQAMTAAVLVAFAEGKTVIRGIKSLRIKETERVVALENELAKMGIRTSSTHDTLTIHGGSPRPAAIDTYGDHRMAMAFAVAGTKLPGMVINHPEVVSKTFPEFWQVLDSITPREINNIVLIGMRGSGKNTVGALLASRLNRTLIDVDAQIVEQAGMSIPQMVEQHGWPYFRDQESAMATQLSGCDNSVIATGGGIILRPDNVQSLKRRGTLVLLSAKPQTLAKRIAGDANRPALTNKTDLLSELEAVWGERKAIYKRCADITVGTDGQSPEAIAEEILAKLGITA